MPPILSTSHCEFNGTRLCTHIRKTISLAQIHSFTKQIVLHCIHNLSPKLMEIVFTGFWYGCYKGIPSMNILVCLFLSFSSHTFLWACGSLREPQKFSLFVHSLVCPITHLFLDEFQPNLVQNFPQVCYTCHTVFSLKKTLECVCERLLHCRLISAIT